MRVLVVHNRYQSSSPSGENRVVDEEPDQLRRAGVDVATYALESDSIGHLPLQQRVLVPLGPVYSPSGVAGFREAVEVHRPHVVHLHNVYPLVSPWVVRSARSYGLPVVQTVHNFRHMCMKGTFFRDGAPCEDCLGRRVGWPGVIHRCYRQSLAGSVAMGAGLAVHAETWRSLDRLLPVSRFVADQLVRGGFPEERITVRHQGMADLGSAGPPASGALFVGRLDDEKGVPDLLGAWGRHGVPGATLTVVGDGPRRPLVEAAAARDPSIRYLGPRSPEEVRAAMAGAAVVVVPSRVYEGLPRVVVEAFMAGRPVIANRIGSLAHVVDDSVGWSVDLDESSFSEALRQALGGRGIAGKSHSARRRFLSDFALEKSLGVLLRVYSEVSASSGAAQHGGEGR